MEKFNVTTFNVDGTKFRSVKLEFSISRDFTVDVRELTVTKTHRVAPYEGCNFVAGGFSMHTKNFIEVSGFPDVIVLGRNFNHVTSFAYILEENYDELLPKFIDDFTRQLGNQLQTSVNHINIARAKLKRVRAEQCQKYSITAKSNK